MSGKTWFKIRIVLFVLNFAGALFVPNPQIEEFSRTSGMDRIFISAFLVFGAVLLPFMLLFILAIQVINPLSDKIWARPNHYCNPFRLGNPLLFFHFAAHLFAVIGLGIIISSLWRGLFTAIYGLLIVVYALSMLIGVRLAIRVFKRKIAEDTPSGPSS